jgi:hypothetical protein
MFLLTSPSNCAGFSIAVLLKIAVFTNHFSTPCSNQLKQALLIPQREQNQ